MLVRELLLGAVCRKFTGKDFEIGFPAARLQYGGTPKAVLEELGLPDWWSTTVSPRAGAGNGAAPAREVRPRT